MCKTYNEQNLKSLTANSDTGSDSCAEVADIFRLYGADYIKEHPLPATYLKVIHDITVCRTEYLGGHIYKCKRCGYELSFYNSCRNRHCPKCQYTARLKWVEKRKAELLPAGYFHCVFTLPHELNPLILRNKGVCLNLLFKAVSKTLLQFGKNNIKGEIGFITILHSWSQTLLDHFHLHCLIPSVAFSKNKDEIIAISENYLFKVENLSRVFRGKYIEYLKGAYDNHELKFPGKIREQNFKKLISCLWVKDWLVYSKKPFSDPQIVLKYLSRYTHRVAIANHRIISIRDSKVTFTYKDRKNDNFVKEMTLAADEFIRRFLLHVLPESFMKIRYYGFLGNRNRSYNIRLCYKLLGVAYVKTTVKNVLELIKENIGVDITTCPQCKKGQLHTISKILSFMERIKNYDSS